MYCRNVNGVAGLPSGSAAGLVLKNAPDGSGEHVAHAPKPAQPLAAGKKSSWVVDCCRYRPGRRRS
jgi:hypothetical protein